MRASEILELAPVAVEDGERSVYSMSDLDLAGLRAHMQVCTRVRCVCGSKP